jgi:hypothetical protein
LIDPTSILHIYEDLAELRLVSRKTLINFSQPFGIRRFRKVRHHLTKSSLEDLVPITKHGILATCVDPIEFSTARTGNRSTWRFTTIHREDDPFNLEDVDFRREGTHIERTTKVLNNIKAHGNHNVRIGVFIRLHTSRFRSAGPLGGGIIL